jgi:hypothetical protein
LQKSILGPLIDLVGLADLINCYDNLGGHQGVRLGLSGVW